MRVTNVIYDPAIQTDIARVNRETGVLYLNPSIWKRLTADEREFVLLHEEGHLHLQTASEYQANKYAIGKYINVKNLTNAELGKRIQVVTEITDPTRYISGNGGGVDPISAIANAGGSYFDMIGKVFQTLPMIGVGANSRNNSENNKSANDLLKIAASGKNQKQLIILGGSFLLVMLIVLLIFKS